ncbi:hypothetical protein KGY14_07335 [Ameyamaea chiangmaiensis]|uniref:Uncharacterized protein n=1 Tax=Ameyamaea chiangmaiensis TaxID=442969 RepID=A0A850PBG2_9PROT|nr:hypothetical protein [Ameyamaea chiangmaiensis]MBS4075000.1 hypothetical protein [Ameyamaea chiangmaiensis]NVN41288.1 hypothetical protein [Ameyamaea chiangmaiensis]
MRKTIVTSGECPEALMASAITARPELSTLLDRYLASGRPNGFELLRTAAEDAAQYRVFRQWSCGTGVPMATPELCVQLLPQTAMIALQAETGLGPEALSIELAGALPCAVRRHALACSVGHSAPFEKRARDIGRHEPPSRRQWR